MEKKYNITYFDDFGIVHFWSLCVLSGLRFVGCFAGKILRQAVKLKIVLLLKMLLRTIRQRNIQYTSIPIIIATYKPR